jgi:hypothetical protein
MATVGIPIFIAVPSTLNDIGFQLPTAWEKTRPSKHTIDHWRTGDALGAVGGHLCDFVDFDPRNGSDTAEAYLYAKGMMPNSYGTATTPSGGRHEVIAPLGLRKGKRDGIDYQGGDTNGRGRGFVFISPTARRSKITGEMRMYQWHAHPDIGRLHTDALTDTSGQKFGGWVKEKQNSGGGQPGGQTVFTGRFFIHERHTGRIPPGLGHDAIVSFCGYLLKKYPGITWSDYEGLCKARWQEFDQSAFTWDWDECLYQITHCWDNLVRGDAYEVWVKTQNPFHGIIRNPTATPFAGRIGNPTATPYAAAGR